MKFVKIRCRNLLQNEMLEVLFMVLINGFFVKDCDLVVKLVVKMWLLEKKKEKVFFYEDNKNFCYG